MRERFAPVVTLAVALVAVVAPSLDDPAGVALVMAVVGPVALAYACGSTAPARQGLAAVLALVVGLQINVGFSNAPNVEIAIITLPPWWGGLQVRRRRDLVARLAQRTRELEAEQETFIALSVQRERARIARDLHDIVSHHLAVVVIQAGAGRLAEPWVGPVAAQRFATIRDAGAEALAEADRLDAMLRGRDRSGPALTSLLARARAATAVVTVVPADLVLPPELETTAYRIVQEALTNAMKHAPGAPLDLRIALADGRLTITARNTLGARPSAIARTGSGLGLTGMRERVTAQGGAVAAGPDGDGTFCLYAWLPTA